MISSALRLNVLLELVTKASITLCSRPELASLITSEAGLEGRILGGSGFSCAKAFAGASSISPVGCCSFLVVSSVVTGNASSLLDSVTGGVAEPGSEHLATKGRVASKTPKLHFRNILALIVV